MRGVNTLMVTSELMVLFVGAVSVIAGLAVVRQIRARAIQERRDLGLPPRASLWKRLTSRLEPRR